MIPKTGTPEYKVRKLRQALIKEKQGTDKAQFRLQSALIKESQENKKERESEQNQIRMAKAKYRNKIVLERKIREAQEILKALQEKRKSMD